MMNHESQVERERRKRNIKEERKNAAHYSQKTDRTGREIRLKGYEERIQAVAKYDSGRVQARVPGGTPGINGMSGGINPSK